MSSFVSSICGYLLWLRVLVCSLIFNRWCFVLLVLSFCIFFSYFGGSAFAIICLQEPPSQSLSAHLGFVDIAYSSLSQYGVDPMSQLYPAVSGTWLHKRKRVHNFFSLLFQARYTFSSISPLNPGLDLCFEGCSVSLPSRPLLPISSPGLRVT